MLLGMVIISFLSLILINDSVVLLEEEFTFWSPLGFKRVNYPPCFPITKRKLAAEESCLNA